MLTLHLAIISGIFILQINLSIAESQKASTTVKIQPGSQNVRGELRFTQEGTGVSIKGTITGLKPGLHGFHIHENGDLGNACKSAGAHFNPYQKQHGDVSSSDSSRHVGDLGNIEADSSGTANINIFDKLISLDPNYKSFIGSRAIVVHEGRDDLGQGGNEESLKTGNAGGRAGCGLIDYSAANNLPIITPLQLIIGCILCAVIMKLR